MRLRAAGYKVVLVSSGAIGVGLQRMSMPLRPKCFQANPSAIRFFDLHCYLYLTRVRTPQCYRPKIFTVLRCARVHPLSVLAIDPMKVQLLLPPDYWQTRARWIKGHYHHNTASIVIQHYVSCDRVGMREWYDQGNRTRSLDSDTMALRVAIEGISSGQRPMWMKHH